MFGCIFGGVAAVAFAFCLYDEEVFFADNCWQGIFDRDIIIWPFLRVHITFPFTFRNFVECICAYIFLIAENIIQTVFTERLAAFSGEAFAIQLTADFSITFACKV
nr:hypothetical protein [Phascolarctobacterium succinatutens]